MQGAFGQMNLAPDRLSQRLGHRDMNFGPFRDALAAVKQRDAEIALAASKWPDRFTTSAALLTLLATALFVLRLSQVRARQARELQAERIRTLAASEARFRELVQHSSDLILVLQSDG